MRLNHVYGFNSAIATATPADVWSEGGTYPFPAAPGVSTVVSASANDAAAGTGVRTVLINGLDQNFAELSETVILNGTTPVNCVNQYYRINTVQALTAGSGGTAAGKISFKVSGTTIATIELGQGRCRMAIFTIPGNLPSWIMTRIFGSIVNATAGYGWVRVLTRKNGGVWQERGSLAVYGSTAPYSDLEYDTPLSLLSGEDVRLQCATGVDATAIAAGFFLRGNSSFDF